MSLGKNIKTVYLIRHAKSSWSEVGLSDFDRTLNDRGNLDAVTMGKRLKAKNILPDYILSSSSKRTKKTAKKITKEIGINYNEVDFNEAIYHASYEVLMHHLTNINDKHQTVFLIGHNPGISNFCDYLTHQALYFPTCGIAKITFEVDSWQEITSNSGTLAWFDYPKNNN